jgi:poly-gamma-glutamate capsule biosynthesis protein CapA/YwtB (metallophosphatase superfamily)
MTDGPTPRKRRAAVLGLVAVAAVVTAVLWRGGVQRRDPESATRKQTTGPITVVLTGDSLVVTDKWLEGVPADLTALVRESTVAITNLELVLSDRPPAAETPGTDPPVMPRGTARTAEALRRLGFNMVSCANNHAGDHGADGLRATPKVLDQAGVRHAGCGADLEAARAPASLGDPPRRVSMISVTTSSAPEARATRKRGDISGRPGVSPLRYTADVTVDQATFDALKGPLSREVSSTDMVVSGRKIRRGDRTGVEFVADEGDVREVLEAIRTGRAQGDVVILTLHSHEPGNASSSPAEFARRFAQAAVDAGAQIVAGHGPHRLRGVERYKDGVIFHSLGDFIYERSATAATTPDVFDAGIDLYQLALGAVPMGEGLKPPSLTEDVWAEGAVVVATFDGPVLRSARIVPLDLGVDLPPEGRGIPRIAASPRAAAILDRVARLSAEFKTDIVRSGDTATVAVRP